jgi:ribonuclease G
LTLDHFAITFMGTRAEVEERALPFRQGDEVLVEIVEPHMYDVDDAVAKIDGYIISIAGAAPHVGEKRMVRIEQVGRTAATALLLDESGEVVRPAPRAPAPPKRRRAPRKPKAAAAVAKAAESTAGTTEPETVVAESNGATSDSAALASESDRAEGKSQPVAVSTNGDAPEEAEDGLSSKPRRRGRRGGRRRSAAKAQSPE